jgi:CobQ-like glutamine amidotransferase family enzyme
MKMGGAGSSRSMVLSTKYAALHAKGCNLEIQAEHSTLLVCGIVVLFGEYFLTFRMMVVPSSSGSSSLNPLKGQEALAQ